MATTQRGEKEYAYAKLPWRASCDHEPGCKFAELFSTEEAAGHAEFSHVHDYRGQVHHNGMSIVESLWVELDARIDEIRSLGADAPELLKGRAQGLAWALSYSSTPFYPTEQDVLKETMRRWKMRHGEMPWEPTIGYKFWAPPPGQPMPSNDPRQEPITFKNATLRETRKAASAPATRTRVATAKKTHNLKPAEVTFVKDALANGMYTPEQIAPLFKLTVEQVEEIKNS